MKKVVYTFLDYVWAFARGMSIGTSILCSVVFFWMIFTGHPDTMASLFGFIFCCSVLYCSFYVPDSVVDRLKAE